MVNVCITETVCHCSLFNQLRAAERVGFNCVLCSLVCRRYFLGLMLGLIIYLSIHIIQFE